MPHTRAPELTYYDELGIARNATPDQVRDAFRALVRLLHPDQHTDEQLKAVAETQMRKLNRIYSVLSDSERRKSYDYSLDEDHETKAPLMSERLSDIRSNKNVGRFAWIGAVVIVVILLTLLASESPTLAISGNPEKAPVATAATAETGARAPDLATDLARTRADLRIALFERDAAIRELEKMRGRKPASPAGPSVEGRLNEPALNGSIGAMTELPGTPNTSVATEIPSAATPPPSTLNGHLPSKALSGFWFYLRTPEDRKNPGLYPPEFIEATISEQNGHVKGRYRSRYRIVDRAISPDVNFEFNGRLSGNTVTALWAGPGGARGDMIIRLMSDNSMRVEWTAEQLGSVQGLTSGTAALTRRLD